MTESDSPDAIYDALDEVFGSSGYRRTMGLRIVRGPGTDAIVECEVTPPYANTQGVAHGGLISGLIDTAAGIAVKLASGEPRLAVATVSLTVSYHRPGKVGRTLRAVGRRVSGSGTPSCQVEVHDDHGVHVASGMATLRARRP